MRSILLRTFLMVAMGSTSFRRPRPSPVGAVGGSFRVTAARGPCGACGSAVSWSVVARPVNGPVRVPVCPPDGWARTAYDLDNHGIAGFADGLRDGGHTSAVRSAIPAATFTANAQRTRSSPAPPLPRRARAGPGRGGGPHLAATGRELLRPRHADLQGVPLHGRDRLPPDRPAAPRPRRTCAWSRWAGTSASGSSASSAPRSSARSTTRASTSAARSCATSGAPAAASTSATSPTGRQARTTPRSPATRRSAHRVEEALADEDRRQQTESLARWGIAQVRQRQLPRRARADLPGAARRRRDRRAARHQHRQRLPAPPPRPEGTGEDPP